MKLFYLRSINPMIEKINPTIPIPITSSPIPDEQRESIMAKSSIAIPNPIFFTLNPPLQMPICCLIFVFKLYHKTCEQFYRNFGLYEKSPNSFLPGLPHSIVNQFDFHNFLCLCLASVHLPYPFHLVSAFSFSVTPFRFASSGTISSMRFRAASSILVQYCLTYTQLCRDAFCFTLPSQCHAAGRARV